MSDLTQAIIMLLIMVAGTGGLIWYSYARQKRIEKRREADEKFRAHRGGGPR